MENSTNVVGTKSANNCLRPNNHSRSRQRPLAQKGRNMAQQSPEVQRYHKALRDLEAEINAGDYFEEQVEIADSKYHIGTGDDITVDAAFTRLAEMIEGRGPLVDRVEGIDTLSNESEYTLNSIRQDEKFLAFKESHAA